MVTQSVRGRLTWVLLTYRMPREPSTPRIAVWRRLRRLGVAQIGDGLVALPLDSRNREQLEWIADEVTEGGGSSSIWIGHLASSSDEHLVVEALARQVASEYADIAREANAARTLAHTARRTTLRRLRRELRRVRQRDYFPPSECDVAIRAIEDLAALVEVGT
jgi:hypothetical protein